MIKTLSKLRIKKNFLTLIQSICGKPTTNIRFNAKSLNTSLLGTGGESKAIHLQHFYSILNWKYETEQREKEREKGRRIAGKEVKKGEREGGVKGSKQANQKDKLGRKKKKF